MSEVRLNQKNVLRYLELQATPCSASDIRFMLDASHGNVYPLSSVMRILEALERKGKVRRLAFGQWAAKEAAADRDTALPAERPPHPLRLFKR